MLEALSPISLEEVLAETPLQHRVDSKHIAPRASLEPLLAAIAPTHRVLEVAGSRVQTYDSVYFDCPRLSAYRAHLQGRRRRYKIRTRLYETTGFCALEIKLKGPRGMTLKERLPDPSAGHGALSGAELEFVDLHLCEAYGKPAPRPLTATLRTRFERLMLVDPTAGERITVDFDLRYGAADDLRIGLRPDYVVVETKSRTGRGPAELALRGLGSRPRRVSKYCLGLGLCREDVHGGHFVGPLRRYLDVADA
jgi:hypothetical protein